MTELSLEQLLDIPIVIASRFAQKVSQAPAAVTAITQYDIRQYGWACRAPALKLPVHPNILKAAFGFTKCTEWPVPLWGKSTRLRALRSAPDSGWAHSR